MSSDIEEGFVKLIVEQWRLIRVLDRLIVSLPLGSQARVAAQARFASSRLDNLVQQHGFQIAIFNDRVFEANLPVTAINADEFPIGSKLRVTETIEPTVLAAGRVIQMGKVSLSNEAEDASRY